MVCVLGVGWASAEKETFFVASENEPIKAIMLLKPLNKKEVKVAAGETPRESKRQKGELSPRRGQSCRLPDQAAARPRLLVGPYKHLAGCACLPIPHSSESYWSQPHASRLARRESWESWVPGLLPYLMLSRGWRWEMPSTQGFPYCGV